MITTRIDVKTSNRDYCILIKKGLSGEIPALLSEFFPKRKKIFFISNKKIFNLHGKRITDTISLYYDLYTLLLQDGEEYKSLESLTKIYDFFIKNHAHRDSIAIAFGGGVLGDTVGFAAATFNRGMYLLQYPTTIIAQVDSSIGGKTAVNYEGIKNIIGCFYQPHLVLNDPDLLVTLAEKELVNGLGEVLKYGLVFDFEIIEILKDLAKKYLNSKDILKKIITDDVFNNIIIKCSRIKADVISKDEYDSGIRNLLNFGHTIGHALEKVIGFKNINHGQAVALGMLCAVDLSADLGFIENQLKNELLELYRTLKLPEKIDLKDSKEILEAIKFDKKISNGKIRFIVLKKINKAAALDNIDETFVKNSIIKNMK